MLALCRKVDTMPDIPRLKDSDIPAQTSVDIGLTNSGMARCEDYHAYIQRSCSAPEVLTSPNRLPGTDKALRRRMPL
jgi:hypothetical protein